MYVRVSVVAGGPDKGSHGVKEPVSCRHREGDRFAPQPGRSTPHSIRLKSVHM